MGKELVVDKNYSAQRTEISTSIEEFTMYSETLGDAERNVIKVVPFEREKITIKSFKIPNVINQIAYRFFRKSKAERSYAYAKQLLELGIGTPKPIAYQIEFTPLLFKKSYYLSELVVCDLTYRELTTDFSIPDYENILRAFTRFTYKLHQKGVNFLDHSPGNTLIVRKEDGYEFYLVDLNRMKFGKMDFETRIKNFAKLTIHRSMIEIMSNEYAKCTGENEQDILNLMWKNTEDFQHKFYRKKRLKKRLLFWQKRD
ncbi:lipopolysaccharide kinase InaA family protein [Aquimarina sp. 2-A2]|uniref:lipopolysaccharide kinase InaA family protein n=1 Tax=Aquimarina sp. 2-A2 TaxID=3382644 RepID=UPI00387F104E